MAESIDRIGTRTSARYGTGMHVLQRIFNAVTFVDVSSWVVESLSAAWALRLANQ
jgi:hypothetical protein